MVDDDKIVSPAADSNTDNIEIQQFCDESTTHNVDDPEDNSNVNDSSKHDKLLQENFSYEMVPPDGGWGWLVLGGAMLVNILVPGTIKSFGVLFVEFLEAFDASPSAAAWIPALCYFLYSSLGPLSSVLSVKYSYRTVTLIGGTFAAVGMMLSFWATSLTYLYFSYGIFVGIGAGLSFPPTVYIVTSYFVQFRGLANGICISGSAFGSIILPPILRYLLENFGYRGAVLIMGGLTLNTWVAALFYDPVENHMKRVKKTISPPNIINDELIIIEEEGDEGIYLEFPNKNIDEATGLQEQLPTGDIVKNKSKFDENLLESPKLSIGSQEPREIKFTKNPIDDNEFARSISAAVIQYGNNEMDDLTTTNSRLRKSSTPMREMSYINNDKNSNHLQSISSQQKFQHMKYSSTNPPMRPKRSPSSSSFQYISTPYHGTTLSFQPEEFTSHLSLKSIASSMNPVTACLKPNKNDIKQKNKFLDLSLLRDPTYLVILISNSTNAIGYTNFIILLPAYAGSLGFDKNSAAYLLSIVSMLDLIGRIGGSALSDAEFIPKTWYFVGGLSISGASLAILPLAKSYPMVSTCCGIFGLASGTYVGVTAVIMADMLGTERLTSSYGISLFVNGILQLIGPPICGVLFENIGTYAPLLTSLGLILLSGASLWSFMPIINRKKKLNKLNVES